MEAWVAAVAAVVSALIALIGTHVSGRVAQARLDATLEALGERVRLKSGKVDRVKDGLVELEGRMKRAESDIRDMKSDLRETRDGVRNLIARLEG